MEQEEQDDQRDDDQLFNQRVLQRGDALADEPRPVVGRNDLHPFRQGRFQLGDARPDRVDHVERIRARARDDDSAHRFALTVEVRKSPPLRRPHAHRADVAQQHRRPHVRAQHDLLQVLGRFDVAAAAHVVLGSTDFQDPTTHVRVRHADHVHDSAERDVERRQPVRVEIDLILLHEPADARDLCHARHRLKRVTDVPVLDRLELLQRRVSGLVDQRVFEHPADAGSVRAEDRCHASRQLVRNARQLLQHAAARPVQIGAVLEDDVHERHAEHRLPADCGDARRAEQRRHHGIRDVVLDQVGGTAHPFREDDHLDVGEVGDRIQRSVPQRQHAPRTRECDEQQRREAVLRGPGDDPGDHGLFQRGRALRSCASLDKRNVACVATSSPSLRPARTSS